MTSLAQRSLLLGFLGASAALTAFAGLGQQPNLESKQGCDTNLLVNPSFDQPVVSSGWQVVNEASMPGWSAEPGAGIEVWASGFLGFDAKSGPNLVELNYLGITLVFQDVTTTPGTELTWSSHHQSRSPGDEVEVLIGPAGGALTQLSRTETPIGQWMALDGTYVVPDGQSVTRFGVRGVSDGSAGNLADDLYLAESCNPLPPAIRAVDDAFSAADLPAPLDVGRNDEISQDFVYTSLPTVAPSQGSVTVDEFGFATYVPNPAASGIDSFMYELCVEVAGEGLLCESALVTIDLGL